MLILHQPLHEELAKNVPDVVDEQVSSHCHRAEPLLDHVVVQSAEPVLHALLFPRSFQLILV
jgi:hypothetical protein